tara:strand:+ start:228 stop:1376 length:1149 start_codon:yes stop_codon:yes gene_type:complete
MLRIGIVVGEPSGDTLGAGLVRELRKKNKNLKIEGIGGEKLKIEKMDLLFPMEKLSVMGFTEVLGRYFELRSIRNKLIKHFLKNPPDIFIGIDSPDFNLCIEKRLRKAGIKTIHYVSPSVWAWRMGRVKKIKDSVDLILNVFPFETQIYDRYGVPNKYIGHPLADLLSSTPNIESSRNSLGLPLDKRIIALLPGSRRNEIKRIAAPLLKASLIAKEKDKNLLFICALIDNDSLEIFKKIKNKIAPNLDVNVYIGKTHQAIESSDIVMLASGTATLESMLLYKPMIVAYKMSWLTYLIVKLLAKLPYASIPNILANDCIVPECLQYRCTPKILASELDKFLNSTKNIKKITSYYEKFSKKLRKQADYGAANAVLQLIENDKLN